jgi:RNA recognition motif-containing protein
MKLYVGNLPYQATEGDLGNFFSENGFATDSVTIVRDRFSGEARGFGFVEIHNREDADRAVRTCSGKSLMGRALVINEARPPAQGGGGGGFGGGRERRGGGGGGGGGGRGRREPRW